MTAPADKGYTRFTAAGSLRSALETNPDCSLILDSDGIVRFANPSALRTLGAGDESEVVGAHWITLLPDADRPGAQLAFEAAARGEARFVAPLRSDTGKPRRFDHVLSPLNDPEGATVALLVISRDITDLEEKAQRAVAQRSILVRSAAEMARLVGFEIDFRHDRVVQTNDAGDPEHRADTIERTLALYDADDQVRIQRLLERARLYGEPFNYEAPLTTPEGARAWTRVLGEPIFEDGVCVGVRGAGMDISHEVAARESIRSAQQRLKLATELAGLEVYEFDFDRQLLIREDSSASVLNSPLRSEDILLPDMLDMVDPQDRGRVQAQWESAKETQTPFRSEFRLHLRDGREMWVSCVAELAHALGRPQRLVAALTDITERKRNELELLETLARMRKHEARQKLLLDELNHRVKNTLAAVQSVAMQTLTDRRDAIEGRELFLDRLLALSATHNLLVRNAWERASFKELVDIALSPYGHAYDHEGPDLYLDANFAVTLGMALHELATNAMKHGAWREQGQVNVATAIDGAEACITWRESGGSPVSPPTQRGFGSRLLQRGVAGELGGTVTLEFASDGLVCRICAPLSARLRPWRASDEAQAVVVSNAGG